MNVSIIIVNFNTKDLLDVCLDSIYKYTQNIEFEIIVSDNGSTDGSIEMLKTKFPNVILIENGKNLGFGAANNKGLNIAKGKYILYLNSDTILLNNAVKIFYDYWEHSENKENIGAIGANLLNSDNSIVHSYGVFPKYKNEILSLLAGNIKIFINEFFYVFHLKLKSRNKKKSFQYYKGEVDYITGADLFLKNDENAYFDEKFFLYFEETDLQNKMKDKNLKRLIVTGPEIIHLEGKSNVILQNSIFRYLSFSAVQIIYSRIIYFKKNYNRPFLLFIIYILSQLYFLHLFLIKRTGKYRKQLRSIYYKKY